MASGMVLAFGDTRLLPQLLLGATEAVCAKPAPRAAADASACELLCEPQLAAAWTSAAARLLPGQAPELLQCVRDCLTLASRAGTLSDGGAPAAHIAALTELLAANVAGVSVTPEAAAALAGACVALQLHIGSLLQELPLSAKSFTPPLQAVAALLLRLCTVVAALVEACSACTSGLGVPASTVSQCIDVARSALSRLSPHLEGARGRACTPWFQLEAARCAMLLATWQSRGAVLDCAAVVAAVCPRMLAPETLKAAQLSAWDGVVSSVSREALPCALWQLVTEHMAAWCVPRWVASVMRAPHMCPPTEAHACVMRRCPCVSAAVLDGALAFLVQTAAGLVRTPQDDADSEPAGMCITPHACSRQLLGDASFYELTAVQSALPRVLLGELRAAQEQLTRACGAAEIQRVDALVADIRAGAFFSTLAALPADDTARGGDAAAVRRAVSRLLRLVALVGWIPAPYFAPSELQLLLAQLLQLEQRVVCTLVAHAADGFLLSCNTLRIVRTVVAGLLTAAEAAPEWTSELQLQWVLHSLHMLGTSGRAGGASAADAVPAHDFAAAAVQSGTLLGQLLQCMLAAGASNGAKARAVERVLAAVVPFCSDLPALAVTCAAAAAELPTAKQPATRLLPRTVVMQRHLSKAKVRGPCGDERGVPAQNAAAALLTRPPRCRHRVRRRPPFCSPSCGERSLPARC
jgi:hypothetical protein